MATDRFEFTQGKRGTVTIAWEMFGNAPPLLAVVEQLVIAGFRDLRDGPAARDACNRIIARGGDTECVAFLDAARGKGWLDESEDD